MHFHAPSSSASIQLDLFSILHLKHLTMGSSSSGRSWQYKKDSAARREHFHLPSLESCRLEFNSLLCTKTMRARSAFSSSAPFHHPWSCLCKLSSWFHAAPLHQDNACKEWFFFVLLEFNQLLSIILHCRVQFPTSSLCKLSSNAWDTVCSLWSFIVFVRDN